MGRLASWVDGLRVFVERHWKIALVLMVLLTGTAIIQSYEATHSLSAQNARRIDTLFAQRDERRATLDAQRYKAALAGCRRSKLTRAGVNDIAQILKDAFAPVTAAEKAGTKETPLVMGLAVAAQKLQVLPPLDCLALIPNPDKLGHQ